MATDLGTVVPHVACLMTLDFSRRYSDILAPITAPVGVNFISRYFPKRLELSLMAVHALPNASTRGFTWRIFSRSVRLLALKYKQQMMFKKCDPDFWSANLTVIDDYITRGKMIRNLIIKHIDLLLKHFL